MKIYRYCGVFLLTLFLSVQLCTNVSAAESVQNSIGISELSGLTEDNEEIYEIPIETQINTDDLEKIDMNERSTNAIATCSLSLVRNGNSKNVHVYIKYKSNQLMNHIKFKQLKIMTPNLLSPLTYKTYEDKSYKFTARKSGYVNIGDASIPKTVKYVRVVSSKFIIKDIKQSISDDQMKVFIFNVIHSMDGENALPKDIKLRAYSIEYSTSSKIYYEEMNDDMKIYVYIDEYTGCIESNSVRLFTELELYKRISQYDYDNNTDKLIEYLHNCKEWEELNSHERKWMSSNFLLQIFVLIFSLMLITMVYKDKNVS